MFIEREVNITVNDNAIKATKHNLAYIKNMAESLSMAEDAGEMNPGMDAGEKHTEAWNMEFHLYDMYDVHEFFGDVSRNYQSDLVLWYTNDMDKYGVNQVSYARDDNDNYLWRIHDKWSGEHGSHRQIQVMMKPKPCRKNSDLPCFSNYDDEKNRVRRIIKDVHFRSEYDMFLLDCERTGNATPKDGAWVSLDVWKVKCVTRKNIRKVRDMYLVNLLSVGEQFGFGNTEKEAKEDFKTKNEWVLNTPAGYYRETGAES